MQRPSPRFRSDVYISYMRYPEKCFTQIFGVLYGNTMLVPIQMVACVASVSNRVIARTLERKQKKVEGGGGGEKRKPSFPSPSPVIHFFLLLSCPSFLDEPREETLATQAIQMGTNVANGNQQRHLLTSFVTKA